MSDVLAADPTMPSAGWNRSAAFWLCLKHSNSRVLMVPFQFAKGKINYQDHRFFGSLSQQNTENIIMEYVININQPLSSMDNMCFSGKDVASQVFSY